MRYHCGGHKLNIWICGAVAAIAVISGCLLDGCAAAPETVAECYYLTRSMQRTLPANELYTLCVDTKEGSRLDVYFQIAYTRLHFEKDQDAFTGTYGVSFILRNEDGTVVRTRDIDRTVVAQTYSESVSSRRDAFLQTFLVPAGVYLLDVVTSDTRSGLQYRRRYSVGVKDFPQDTFCTSDYLLFERGHQDQRTISLRPVFPSELSFAKDSIGIFQEIYNIHRGDTIQLSLSCTSPNRMDGDEVQLAPLLPPYHLQPPCMYSLDSTYYRLDSMFVSPSEGTLQLLQYFPRLKEGLTIFTRKIFLHRQGSIDSSVSTAKFAIYAPSFPRLRNIDEEIAAVQYIALKHELDSLKGGTTPAERAGRLTRFWEDHGGDVRRKEYLSRVQEANELFSTCTEGWKTPMGIAYIVCGAPDYVECQRYLSEIWYYDIGGNRAFAIPFRQRNDAPYDRYFEITPFSVSDYVWESFVYQWRKQ